MRIEDHGFAVDLPPGWEGRVFLREGDDPPPLGPVLQAANVPLVDGDDDRATETCSRLPSDGVVIAALEYAESSRYAEAAPFPKVEPPIRLRVEDFQPLQGVSNSQSSARLGMTVGGRALDVFVVFGASQPAVEIFSEAATVLASLLITPKEAGT